MGGKIMRKNMMKILSCLIVVGSMFAGVVPCAGAPGDDYHVYSKFNAPGTGLVSRQFSSYT
ncbi:MAG: hypothetical protein AEth_01743 [Candidatus Argoarchaeum ethanivorans]|uniref:Uncharacterized protein n=1 Tax=Candidatus Argoarchaeum ethanivorans TaxID=2608793 RepID=A0A8B3S0T3_9EURY|nr:MAG: hypothetical protein AEth_01743 [Candidatus Argoarchaeum ethanivorans]